MQNPFTGWTRRYFLQGAGLTSLVGSLGCARCQRQSMTTRLPRAPAKHAVRFTKSLACGLLSMRPGRIQR